MKPLIIAFLLSVTVAPVYAQSVDVSGIFPTLTYPEPATDTVTQDDAEIDN